MAKAGKHTGASFTQDELNDPSPPVVIRRAMLGGDPSLAGSNSPESGPKTKQPEQQSKPDPQEPAPTTENPSKLSEEIPESSNANLTDGNTPETGKASGRRRKPATSKTAAKEDNPKAARVRSMDEDEFDDFE